MSKRIVILGAPGAGKGTQARAICEKLALPTFSTGAMLREEIAAGTELGKTAQELINQGCLVPDEVINPMVARTLNSEKFAEGFLADGYPRSVAQAQNLKKVLAEMGTDLDLVINIDVDLEAVVGRMLHRAEIEHRADDTEPVIRHRLKVYHETTEPVVEYYRNEGILLEIDGNGTIEEVWERIEKQL